MELGGRFRDGGRMSSPVIAIAGASGGVGVSTLAAAVTLTAAEVRGPAVCVDADDLGGGVDLHFGVEDRAGVRWPDLTGLRGAIDLDALVGRLPAHGAAYVLSHARADGSPGPPDSERAHLVQALRTRGPVVVAAGRLRSAPWWGDVVDVTVLIVAAHAAGLAAAPGAMRRLQGRAACVVLVGPAAHPELADVVTQALDVDVVGCLRPHRRASAALDAGCPPPLRGRGGLGPLAADLLLYAETERSRDRAEVEGAA